MVFCGLAILAQPIPPSPETTETVGFSEPFYHVLENAGELSLPLTRPKDAVGPLTLTVKARRLTATPGIDFEGLPAEISFTPGSDKAELRLTILDNLTVDGNRAFELSASPSEGEPFHTTVWINDNERALVLDPSTQWADRDYTPLAQDSEGFIYADYRGELVKLNPEGQRIPEFKLENFDSEPAIDTFEGITHVIVSPSGELIVAGFYESYRANTFSIFSWVRRYQSDGSLVEGSRRIRLRVTFLSAMYLQPDGQLVYTGDFENFQTGSYALRVDRLLENGGHDTAFGSSNLFPDHQGSILTSGMQRDGSLLLAGRYDQIIRESHASLVRFDTNGELDAGFSSPLEPGSTVHDLAVGPDDHVWIAGDLLLPDGQQYRLLRLTPNGSLASTVSVPIWENDTVPNKLVVDSDRGWLYNFQTIRRAGASTLTSLSRFDLSTGLRDEAFRGIEFDHQLPNGYIGIDRSGFLITRYGRIFTDLVDRQSVEFGEARHDLRETDQGTLINVQRLGSSENPLTVQLNPESLGGAGEDLLGIPRGISFAPGETHLKLSVDVKDNGTIDPPKRLRLTFQDENGQPIASPRNQTELYLSDNEIPHRLDLNFTVIPNLNGIATFEPLADGHIMVAQSYSREPITLIRPDGSRVETFSSSDLFPAGASIHTVKAQDQNRILAGGRSQSVTGREAPSLVRFSASTGNRDEDFLPPRLGPSRQGEGIVTAIAIQETDGEQMILIGGSFTGPGRLDGLMRLHDDGSVDETFTLRRGFQSSSRNISISEIQITPQGAILVAGRFDIVDEIESPAIIRLLPDGQPDESFRSPFMPNNEIYALAIDQEEKILLSVRRNGQEPVIRRLLPDGTPDAGFQSVSLDGIARSIVLGEENTFFIAGDFRRIADFDYPGIGKLTRTGAIALDFVPSASPDTRIQKLSRQPDGSLLVGGNTSSFDRQGVNKLFRLSPDKDPSKTLIIFSTDSRDHSLDEADTDREASLQILRLGNTTDPHKATVEVLPEGATRDEDYLINTTAIEFGPFEVEQEISVTPLDDGLLEAIESVQLQIEGTPSQPVQTRATITIYDDEIAAILDHDFSPPAGLLSTHRGLEQLPDGKIFVRSYVDTLDGNRRRSITRLLNDGSLDPTFSMEGELDGTVDSVSWTDQWLLIGGDFRYTHDDNIGLRNLVRLKPDGKFDPTSVDLAQPTDRVQVIKHAADGAIYIGGSFRRVNSHSRDRLARLHPSGQLDDSFLPPSGFADSVQAIAFQSDNRILVGGAFNLVDQQDTGALVRLNTDGSLDSSFSPEVNGSVYDLLVLADESVLVAGRFSIKRRPEFLGLVKLRPDGSIDPTFSLRLTSGEIVRLRRDNEKVVIGGSFHLADQPGRYRIAWMSLSGEITRTYPDQPRSNTLSLHDFVIDHTGKPIISTSDGSYASFQIEPLVRLDLSDPSQTTYNALVPHGPVYEPDGLTELTVSRIGDISGSGSVQISHSLPISNSEPRLQLATELIEFAPLEREQTVELIPVDNQLPEPDSLVSVTLNTPSQGSVIGRGTTEVRFVDNDREGSLNTEFQPLIHDDYDRYFNPYRSDFFDEDSERRFRNAPVRAIEVQSNDRILITGDFSHVNRQAISGIARLFPDGTSDTSYQPTLMATSIEQISLQSDDRLVVLGYHHEEGAILFRLDHRGQQDESFHSLSNSSGANITGMTVLPDDRVVIWGDFRDWEDSPNQTIAMLLPDGEIDPHFADSAMIHQDVYSVQFQSPDALLVSGAITRVNGSMRRGIARLGLAGDFDESFPANGGPNNDVYHVQILGNEHLQIQGGFTQFGGMAADRVALTSPDGDLITDQQPLPHLSGVQPLPDGSTYILGEHNARFPWFHGVARLTREGTPDPLFDVGEGLDGYAEDVGILSNGDLLISGTFYHYNSIPVGSLLRINGRIILSIRGITRQSDGKTRIDFDGTPGATYHLEHSIDLQFWTIKDSLIAEATQLSLWDTTSNPESSQGFYRLRQE